MFSFSNLENTLVLKYYDPSFLLYLILTYTTDDVFVWARILALFNEF